MAVHRLPSKTTPALKNAKTGMMKYMTHGWRPCSIRCAGAAACRQALSTS